MSNFCPIKLTKPKIVIYDLTDCEGCELQILALDKKLMDFTQKVNIVNWRLASNIKDLGPFDIALIEGTVITEDDERIIKSLRENSKIVLAIGACACNGGITSLIKEKDRQKLTKIVYGKYYQSLAKNAKPLDKYIKVDYYLNGCPINSHELEEILAQLISGQKIVEKFYPVCLECKAKENRCLLLDNKPCLGTITLGGCNAACTSNNIRCFGCWGPTKDANFPAMIKILQNQGRSKKEISQIMEMFMEENESLKELFKQHHQSNTNSKQKSTNN